MASLYIKDTATTELATRLALRLGTSKTAAVKQALQAIEANLDRADRHPEAPAWLKKFWREHPLPAPTGLKADKAFFDALSDDL
ncbi:type II toxin-antitoxin system VapB family antitoxin [Sphingomonas endolithica]|uniref:type II toxin-antitoxin system VapB family antitoxin n=1 Tax=Sphingomonas endolithica TaxID=2972485 RepID=UPI0021AE891F|nr:type II toxin-antitoxin system VapB family antitoxin [Sphingomonas sp. ZFBP2030]